MRCGQVLKVLEVKRVAGPRNPGAPKCKYVIGLHTLRIHYPVGGRPQQYFHKQHNITADVILKANGGSDGTNKRNDQLVRENTQQYTHPV